MFLHNAKQLLHTPFVQQLFFLCFSEPAHSENSARPSMA